MTTDAESTRRATPPEPLPTAASSGSTPMAIIGMACRFPKALDLNSFWNLLHQGIDAVREVPDDRWSVESLYDPDVQAAGKVSTRWGGFLDQIDRFDPLAFRISPREAAQMDPQQRLMLELSWEALEDAGIPPLGLQGSRTGVFFGAMWTEYGRLLTEVPELITPHTATGQELSIIAGRVSYAFGLRGPSMVVNTSSSSALVAVHAARQSLVLGESTLALAGGVNLMVSAASTIAMSKLGTQSPDGRCKAFAARANGYVRGEGGGVVVLKPLARALADGDRIHAILLGSAINNDGHSTNITTPSEEAQASVLRDACENAGIDPLTVGYVETHGTGTPIGDPVEARALGRVMGAGRPAERPLVIGSVKTNVGHLEAAAGICGLIKTVLSLERRTIPPNLHFTQPNPEIPFDALHLKVATAAMPWPSFRGRCIAGVSSFGFSGTNAHVLLEAPPAAPVAQQCQRPNQEAGQPDSLLLLSAHQPAALRESAVQMARFLRQDTAPPLSEICKTAARHRSFLRERLAVVGANAEALAEALFRFAQSADSDSLVHGRPVATEGAKLIFVFPGQCSEWVGMGQSLLAGEPVFAAALHACDAAIRRQAGFSVLDVLGSETAQSDFKRADRIHPTLFALQVALAQLWRSWGVEPTGVVGHSRGEIAAAHVAGALGLDDAARIICERSLLLEKSGRIGEMALVELPPHEVKESLAGYADKIGISVINGLRSTIAAGSRPALDEWLALLTRRGVASRLLKVGIPGHSPSMDPLQPELLARVSGIAPRALRIPMYSTVTTEAVDGPSLTAEYWARNLREPVHFFRTIERLLGAGPVVFLELSPHPVLVQPMLEAITDLGKQGAAVASLKRDEDERRSLLSGLGALFVSGAPVDWKRAFPGGGPPVSLPAYPWQRQRYWVRQEPAGPPREPDRRGEPVPAEPPAVPEPEPALVARLSQAPPRERARVLEGFVAQLTAEVLRVPVEQMERDIPFGSLGMDSAMGSAICARMQKAFGLSLPLTTLWTYGSIGALAQHLLTRLDFRAESPLAPQPALAKSEAAGPEPLAVIGIGCRFPGGVVDPASFWNLLSEGRDAVTSMKERWSFLSREPVMSIPSWGGLLPEVDQFDAGFFGVSPREAVSLDPQQRLLLEVTWEALENADVVPAALQGSRGGVFVGLWQVDYSRLLDRLTPQELDSFSLTGTLSSVAAGRISYSLGLVGPCVTIDTACSSSLVAVHQACRSLRSGECDLAIAGGVSLILAPETSERIARLQGLSPDGRCKTFDAAANGISRAEGAGVIVLKRLSDALRAGHRIWGLVRGSACNQDGRSSGLTAPNVLSQQALLKEALADARSAASEVGYVEAHGTGTPLGDPIEAAALGQVYGAARADGTRCVVGSVKTNLGHPEAAAGIAGLIKTLLIFKHERIPRHLHFHSLNPRIQAEGSALLFTGEEQPWTRGRKGRIAGVSSFGVSGTNAHVVVEEAPTAVATRAAVASAEPGRMHVLPLSAKTPEALQAQARRYSEYLRQHPELDPRDLVYSAGALRSHFPHRLAVMGETATAFGESLAAWLREQAGAEVLAGQADALGIRPRVVFVFSGQGSQWAGMGRKLWTAEPVFRQSMEACALEFQTQTGLSIVDEILRNEQGWELERTETIQPLLFSIGVSLVALLRSWGIHPDAVVGHSLGEVAAAHTATALSLEDAVRVVAVRSSLLRRLIGQGSMAQIELPLSAARKAVARYAGRLSVAVSNGPRATVISGERAAMDQLIAELTQQGIYCRPVKTGGAGHGPQVDALRDELLHRLRGLQPRRAAIPMYSTVTTTALAGPELTADYWARNLREPVLFSQTVSTILAEGPALFVELSPHPLLSSSLGETIRADAKEAAVLETLRRGQDELRALCRAVARLYVHGHGPDWRRLTPAGQPIELPTYPFQRRRYWIAARPQDRAAAVQGAHKGWGHPMLGASVALSTTPKQRRVEAILDLRTMPWLADHRLGQAILTPGAVFVELALAAGSTLFHGRAPLLREVEFDAPLLLEKNKEEVQHLQLLMTEERSGHWRFQIARAAPGTAGDWSVYCNGRMVQTSEAVLRPPEQAERSLPEARRAPPELASALYAAFAQHGMTYGPAFHGLESVQLAGNEALGKIIQPEGVPSGPFLAHPVLLDACFQVLACTGVLGRSSQEPWMISGIDELILYERLEGPGFCQAQLAHSAAEGAEHLQGDLRVLDSANRVILELKGVSLRRTNKQIAQNEERDERYMSLAWDNIELQPASDLAKARRWLLLGNTQGMGSGLRRRLEALGDEVVHVVAAELHDRPEGATEVKISDPAGVASLIGREFPADRPPFAVVHIGTVDPAQQLLPLGGSEDAVLRECGSVLHLVKALASQGYRDAPRLWLVTQGAQAVLAHDLARPVQAAVVGLGRVIAMEHPELRCTRLDLEAAIDPADPAPVLSALLAKSNSDEFAWRHGSYYAAQLRPIPARSWRQSTPAVPVRADATYLITGGLGQLGRALAAWLVHHGARHLALVSRHGSTQPRQDAFVRELTAAGAQLRICRIDVSEREEVQQLLSDLARELPPIHGIAHAATVLEDAMLANQTLEQFRTVLAAKVFGAINLHELTMHLPLDFFIFYSSFSALLGVPGQGNYAAANSFLDALAHHRRRRGMPALSVNWGAFLSEERDPDSPHATDRLILRGLKGMEVADSVTALQRLLGTPFAQVAFAGFDCRRWLEFYPSASSYMLLKDIVSEVRSSPAKVNPNIDWQKMLKSLPLHDQLSYIERLLTRSLGTILQTEVKHIGRHEPFSRLGLDSLLGLELRNSIETVFQIHLSATTIWSFPTIAALAGHLQEQLARSQVNNEPGAEGAQLGLDDLEMKSDIELGNMLLAKLSGFAAKE